MKKLLLTLAASAVVLTSSAADKKIVFIAGPPSHGPGAHEHRAGEPLPTMVILDLKLPKLDGLGVLKAIRDDARTRLLPVVILTSSKEEQDLISGYSLGANSYVRKPVDFNEFLEAVKVLGIYWLMMNQNPPERAGP